MYNINITSALASIYVNDINTLFILLDSSEYPVVLKAIQAIHKHIKTSSSHRLQVLSIDGAINKILRLIESDDVNIKISAVGCLSSVTESNQSHPELRRLDILQTLVKIANHENQVEIQEDASIALSNLAKDYASKADIRNVGGLHALSSLLTSDDPDVLESSMSALSCMFDDVMNRIEFKKLNVFKSLIVHLKSDYTEIRTIALICVIKLAKDIGNRTDVRNHQVLPILADQLVMIEDVEYIDLVLECLIYCFLDSEMVEEFTSLNPLPILIRIMNRNDSKSKKIILSLVYNAASSKQNIQLIVESELLPNIIVMLQGQDSELIENSIRVLQKLQQHEFVMDELLKPGIIELFSKFISNENMAIRRQILLLIKFLAVDKKIQVKVKNNSEFLQALIKAIQNDDFMCSTLACEGLCALSKDHSCKLEIIKAGVINSLCQTIEFKDNYSTASAVLALSFYCDEDDARTAVIKYVSTPKVIISRLVDFILTKDDKLSQNSIYALAHLSNSDVLAYTSSQCGAIDALLTVSDRTFYLCGETLNKVLEQNISGKYWLKNKLSERNIICDGFYDMGYAGNLRKIKKIPKLDQLVASRTREAIVVDFKNDEYLAGIIMFIQSKFQNLTPMQQIQKLARLVSQVMGGPQYSPMYIKQICKPAIEEFKMNGKYIIQIGEIRNGSFANRALLFKTLCDYLNIAPVTLERGDIGSAWNYVDIGKHELANSIVPVKDQTSAMPAVGHTAPLSIQTSQKAKAIFDKLIKSDNSRIKTDSLEGEIENIGEEQFEPAIVDLMFEPGTFLTGKSAEDYKLKIYTSI